MVRGIFFFIFFVSGFVRMFWEFWRDGCSGGGGRRGSGGVVIECRLVKLLWWWIFVWVGIRMWWQNVWKWWKLLSVLACNCNDL